MPAEAVPVSLVPQPCGPFQMAGSVSHRASPASPKAGSHPVDRASRPASRQRLFPIPNTHRQFRPMEGRFFRKTGSTGKTGPCRAADHRFFDGPVPLSLVAASFQLAVPLSPVAASFQLAVPLSPVTASFQLAVPLSPVAASLQLAVPLSPVAASFQLAVPETGFPQVTNLRPRVHSFGHGSTPSATGPLLPPRVHSFRHGQNPPATDHPAPGGPQRPVTAARRASP